MSTHRPAADLVAREGDRGITTAARRSGTARLFEQLAASGDESERADLRSEIIELNLDVPRTVVYRYRGRGPATDDLEQVARLGLMMAVRRFDPAAGHAFLSFAVPTIRGEVRRYFRDQAWVVRPPRPVRDLQPRIGRATAELYQELQRAPKPDEVARFLDVELRDVVAARSAEGCFAPLSLDVPVYADGRDTVGHQIAAEDGDSGLAAAEARMMLQPVLGSLSARHQHIVHMRFVQGRTQRDIGAELGLSQMHISRQLTRIMSTLRTAIGPVDGP